MRASAKTEEIQEKALYDVRETASLLKVGRSTVLKLIQQKELPAAKVGKQYRILGYYILDYVLGKTEPAGKTALLQQDLAWSERLQSITSKIGAKTATYPVKEIEADISEAVQEVREARRRGRRSA